MQNLNHQVWGKIRRFNQKAAIVLVCVIVLGMFSMLGVSLAREFTVFYNRNCHLVVAYNHEPYAIMEKVGITNSMSMEYEMEETEEGPVLRVSPECSLQVEVDGETYHVISRTDRVENILASLGVVVGTNDIVTPALHTIFTENCTIRVQRVTYQTRAQSQVVEAPVIYEDTLTLPQGTNHIKVQGCDGEETVTYYEKLVDGEVAESSVLSTAIVKEAESYVILRGVGDPKDFAPVVTTNDAVNEKIISPKKMPEPVAVDEKGVPLSYQKCITGIATAYTFGEGGYLTATGEDVQVGYVAVDPKEIPYGTMLYIKTPDGKYMYGVAKACDTGGFINGPVTIDLFFNTHEECSRFGVRDIEIYVL